MNTFVFGREVIRIYIRKIKSYSYQCPGAITGRGLRTGAASTILDKLFTTASAGKNEGLN